MIDCPNLAVPPNIMYHIMKVESSNNPYAIGVVGGRLVRQPQNLREAVATAKMLESQGFNFSVGVAQVNRFNLQKYGIQSYEQAFEPCQNIVAGSRILRECYDRAKNWPKSFSCYYSGNFTTGFDHGYVQKVVNSMQNAVDSQGAIAVIPRRGFTPNAAQKGRGGSTFLPPKFAYSNNSAPPIIPSGALPFGSHPKDRRAKIQVPPGYQAMPAPAMYGRPVGGAYVPPANPMAEIAPNLPYIAPSIDDTSDPFKPTIRKITPSKNEANQATSASPTFATANDASNTPKDGGNPFFVHSDSSAISRPTQAPLNLNKNSDKALIF